MHVRRALALAVVAPLLLAGCTGDPEPEPSPKMPETSSVTPTDEPTETETPQAESAEDFVRRWVEVSNAMQNSGETEEYLRLSAKCGACRRVAQRVAAAFEAGGYARTDGWKILEITNRPGGSRVQTLDVRVDSAPTAFKEDASSDEQEFPGGEVLYRFRLNGQPPWTVRQLTQVAS
jgi:hypothetical protein